MAFSLLLTACEGNQDLGLDGGVGADAPGRDVGGIDIGALDWGFFPPADGGLPPADAGAEDDPWCPPRAERPEPTLRDRFEDGSPEISGREGPYRVIAPEGHEALVEHALAALPGCHDFLREQMGYCHPWREAIVHFGRYESRAKAEDGVVYIGRSEAMLSRLGQGSSWAEPPALCGGQSTFAHESVHTFQPANLPAWLKEGWADYIGLIMVGGSTYECGETSVCIRPPPINGRPPPEACSNVVEYWDLSDPNWSGERPDPGEEPDPDEGTQSNKGRYYKTGTCFWQSLMEVYGADALRAVQQKMHAEPRDDLPVFPFSAATNRLLIQTYFEPLLGAGVWPLIERYGISPD